jgi:hypothetical protein
VKAGMHPRIPIFLLLVAAPGAAAAQALPAAPTNDADVARVEFQRGITALEDERYADALAAFERSFRARRVASVALNLGVTNRALGRLIEARQRFRDFLALASPQQHAQHDVEVAGYLTSIERQIAHVRVSGVDLTDTVLRVNQRRARADGLGEVEVDPGEQHLTIEPDGYVPLQRTVRVEAGETADVAVSPSRPTGWIFTRWWFWTGVAVVAGAGIAAGIVYSQTPVDPPAANTGLTIAIGSGT